MIFDKLTVKPDKTAVVSDKRAGFYKYLSIKIS